MAADGQVLIEIKADNRDAKQTIRDTTHELDNASGKWEKSGDKMSGIFAKIGGAIAAAKIGQKLLQIGKEALEAASALEEVQNVVDVTFGSASGQIDSWAKNAIKQFGLTETQAKQFASTLGAMMKSSGVAGDEIVEMSTKLSGLAADMASFYNLDFDTAFQKIRSGISGETEPLKQLGINMSVVNLEAYALTQGITKSFAEMSQGEQTMLRYQYIMQATADAQGDFSRTSDGYANSLRLLESNMESLKTTLGKPLLSAMAAVTGAANQMFSSLFPPEVETRTSVADTFADIDADAAERVARIRTTADDARTLVNILKGMQSDGFVVEGIRQIAEGANKLDSSSPGNWNSILTAFATNVDGLRTAWSNEQGAATIGELADALSGISGDQSKRDAWASMLAAMDANADGIARMMGVSPETVKGVLGNIAEQASRIDESDARAWDDLLTAFATSFPGLINSDTLSALGTNLNGIAVAGNSLNSDSKGNWAAFLSSLQDIDGLSNIWSGDAGGLESLSEALSSTGITGNRARAWQTMLQALKDNAGAIAELHGDTEENTWNWLDTLATAANNLDPASAHGWNELFSALVEGLPGLEDSEIGQRLLTALSNPEQAQVTNASEDAISIMERLGISTEEVTDQQALWLATCRQLVRMIPSLSRIINTQTGDILGGADAVSRYIDAWEAENTRQIYIDALQQKIDEYNALLNSANVDTTVKRAVLESRLGAGYSDVLDWHSRSAQRLGNRYTADQIIDWVRRGHRSDGEDGSMETNAMHDLWQSLSERDREAFEDWLRSEVEAGYLKTAIPEAVEGITDAVHQLESDGVATAEELADAINGVEGATDSAASATRELSEEQRTAWESALTAVQTAAEAVDEYRRNTIRAAETTLAGWGNVFSRVETSSDKIRRELREQYGEGTDEYRTHVGTSDITSAQGMLRNLQNRATYLSDYSRLMERAREMHYSDEVLAQLADGSLESYDYLQALVAGGDGYVDQINEAYAGIGTAQHQLAEQLAGYTLETDSAFQSLEDVLAEAMNNLDAMVPTDAPALAVGNTIQQVLDTIGQMYPDLATAVLATKQAIGSLVNGTGVTISPGHGGGASGREVGSGFRVGFNRVQGSFASGLDYVPFDGFIGQLHRGEAILTAEEAQVWREFRNGIDTNSIADAIWNNSPDMGGNVYLNGEIVGRIMSAAQADSYRQLERSGWRG